MNLSTRQIRSWLVLLWDASMLELLKCWNLVIDLFDLRPELAGAKIAYSSRNSHRLEIRPYRAVISASCTASVLRSLHLYFSGQPLGQFRAIELMRCRRTGAPLGRIALVLRRRLRCRFYRLRTAHEIRRSLRSGAPVIASDDFSYRPDGHAILITGYTVHGFHTIDPATGTHRWRTSERLLRASDEFIAIQPKD